MFFMWQKDKCMYQKCEFIYIENVRVNKNGLPMHHVFCTINLYGMINFKPYPNKERSYVWHDSLETWYRGLMHALWVMKHISAMFYEHSFMSYYLWNLKLSAVLNKLLSVTIRITNRCDFLYYVFISFFSKYFFFFSNLIHFYFSFYIYNFYNFSLHVSDRLVHDQENQIRRAASGTFPSFVVISCVAVGANWVTAQLAPTATHEITTNEGRVPDAARVIWFSWWSTNRSETCREKL